MNQFIESSKLFFEREIRTKRIVKKKQNASTSCEKKTFGNWIENIWEKSVARTFFLYLYIFLEDNITVALEQWFMFSFYSALSKSVLMW